MGTKQNEIKVLLPKNAILKQNYYAKQRNLQKVFLLAVFIIFAVLLINCLQKYGEQIFLLVKKYSSEIKLESFNILSNGYPWLFPRG